MNKAAYKLKGLPPIYCINLDGEPERWESAESMFKEWEVENYTRVSAYDGREDDLSDILKGNTQIICYLVKLDVPPHILKQLNCF